ncbi:diaminopimelate decarboxylase [Candidatus Marinamargulisbacteria bacterium SCGC AG-439-L15]|nr:diaminopimelate decarboxylase [Candidatus Marinamargulisbacteria bacterium SCGC AG-439-L15]
MVDINIKQHLELATEYGTPLYVYDLDLIETRYTELQSFISWPKLKIHYAMKANYNFHILEKINRLNGYLDIVSPAEIILAQKAGFTVDRLLYTANNITEDEMKEVHETGILFNIGSLSRLEKYGQAYPGSRVCLRFNPDVVAGAHEKIKTGGDLTKFGILLSDVERVKTIVEKHNLTVVGLHEHTGSGIGDTAAVYQSMRNLLEIATKDNFPNLEFVDFGGGFQVPYHPDEDRIDYPKMGQKITEIFTDFCREYGKELDLYFEPGKYVVAESGTLLVEVNTIKENRTRLIVGTNSGFPQLIRPMFYEAYHHILNLSNPTGEKKHYDICGNICETGDRFAEDRELPELREGDILAIQNAGAYCYVMGGVYNLRSMPAEVVIENGNPRLSRKRLNNEALINSILSEVTP